MSSDAREVAEEYRSSLRDLVNNSKPLITMLTMLAEENQSHANVIVKVIEEHIQEVPGPQKLPVMYLIDSIMKNVGPQYIKLFAYNIITVFTCVFEKVDERTRKKLYELRTTWNEVFPKSRLYGLDVKVQAIDPAWPLPMVVPTQPTASKPNIHINPNIIKPGGVKATSLSTSSSQKNQKDMEILKLKREEELLTLERKKLMLEKKKILLQQSRQTKGEETDKPVNEDPSISSERRSQFLRSYKIKKKAQGEEESKVPNIHLDPRKMLQVLPLVAASSPSPLTQQDSRSRDSTSRDPRLAQEQRASGAETSRDPRLNSEHSRDPRLTSHPAEPSKASRDPRLVAAKEAKDKKDKEKDKDKERKDKEDKKREKEHHHRSSSKKESVSSHSTSTTRESKKKKDSSKASKSSSSSSKISSHNDKDSTTATTTVTTTTTITSASTTTATTLTVPSFSPSSTSSPSKDSKKLSPAPTETTEGPATFKSDRRSRQRTYKKREESPEDTPEPQTKRSRVEVTSDSDSDHYDANRPSPALYNKSGEYVDWLEWAGGRGCLIGPFPASSCSQSCLRPCPVLPSLCLQAF